MSGARALGAIAAAGAAYLLMPEAAPEMASRMVGIFVLATLFWALEIIPLFATALVVIVLEILLIALPSGGAVPAQAFLSPFSNPIILLFFGGFVLAAAIRRTELDRLIAGRLLRGFGDRPLALLLGFMIATAFLGLWISNTATATLMLAMIAPLRLQLDQDDPFRKALVLSIPFAANIGGIGTPVSTPPNAVAIGLLAKQGIRVSFLDWMQMAIPLAIIMIVVTAFILNALFPAKQKRITFTLERVNVDRRALAVGAVFAGTLALWLSSGWHGLPEAAVALMAAATLFATGLLGREDLKTIDWDILVLMWGGLALGAGMEMSGLAGWVTGLPLFAAEGLTLIAAVGILTIVLSTFMSNTAAANLLIPLVLSIPGEQKLLLAVVVALASSFDLALPVATPPNALAFSTGAVTARDMLKAGVWITLLGGTAVILGSRIVVGWAFP